MHLKIIALTTAAVVIPGLVAQAGPPLITDDPETPGKGHWEINLSSTLEQRRTERTVVFPLLDLNYGVGDRVQLKYEIPWVFSKHEGEGDANGIGNSKLGIKWRFLDEKTDVLSISIYPQVEFNNSSSSVARGIVERGTSVTFPMEFGKRFGHAFVYAEAGYVLRQLQPDQWIYGVACNYEATEKLEFMAEIHGTSERGFRETELIVNLGGKWSFSEHAGLIASVGRGLSPAGDPPLLGYLGLQLTF